MSLPRLLVSVRSRDEARAAVSGGCDVLDVKEPANGPLGMASLGVIADVIHFASDVGVECSAACGEVIEADSAFPLSDTAADALKSQLGLHFFKFGPARLGGLSDWQQTWSRTLTRAAERFHTTESINSAEPRGVAVIYADWQRAGAPSPAEILDFVTGDVAQLDEVRPRLAGVLIDTFHKSAGGLLDCMSVEQIDGVAARLRGMADDCSGEQASLDQTSTLDGGRRLFLALAGRLMISDLPRLVSIRPDVIAVRSAACRGGDRTATVDAEATRLLRAEIEHLFCTRSAASCNSVVMEADS
ncbi:MAG: (5-formylfuran-3-yl)methyl phosphate synthase [Planctomycetota bacterium]